MKATHLFPVLLVVCFAAIPALSSESDSGVTASEVEKVAGDFRFTEGPVWHKDGYLLFSDIPSNKIMKWSPKDGISVWRADSKNSNGLTFDSQGCLVACEHNGRVSRTESDGSITTIADSYQGKRLNSPNDLAIRSDGMIFFTDPDYGVSKDQKELSFNGVYRVKPGEKPVLLTKVFKKPNGIAFSPDEKILYIADSGAPQIRSFKVAKDGSLSGEKLFVKSSSDGMKVDTKGNLYLTTNGKVYVYDPSGTMIESIFFPEGPANCAFGDADNKTLYVTARTGLYKVRLKVVGVRVWK